MHIAAEKFKEFIATLKDSPIDIKRFKYSPNKVSFNLNEETQVDFRYIDARDLSKAMKDKIENKLTDEIGVFVDHLSAVDKRNLDSLRIGYITAKGDLCCYFNNRVLKLGHSKTSKPKTTEAIASIIFNAARESYDALETGIPLPTDLISPYGLEILDVIFRLSPKELEGMTPYKFCKDYKLNSNRLFRMQLSLKSKSLAQFQYALKKLPPSWWLTSLTYPRTNQRLSAFRKNADDYVSVGQGDMEEALYQTLEEIREVYGEHAIIPGPGEVLNRLGLLSSNETQLWVNGEKALKKLKQSLRLTPSKARGAGNIISIYLIRSNEELSKQCLLSKAPEAGRFPSEVREINIFRVIWDACNADSRTQNAALDFLRKGILR